MFRLRLFLFITAVSCVVGALLSAISPDARADTQSCGFYRLHAPGLYRAFCGATGSMSARPAASAGSSFSDSFKLNPSTLPTQPSPWGLEGMYHYERGEPKNRATTFSLIKGYRKIGAGLSTSSGLTFFSNDVFHRANSRPDDVHFKSAEASRSDIPDLNFGTSFALPLPKSWVPMALGTSVRHNSVTGTLGFGLGLIAKPSIFLLGFGYVNEKISNFHSRFHFYSAMAAVRLPIVEFEYNILTHQGGPNLRPVHIGTVTAHLGRLMISYSQRRLHYVSVGNVSQGHWSAQFQLHRRLSVGYLYNYFPGANSLASQIFL